MQDTLITCEKDLQAFYKANPGKLIGLSKSLCGVHVKIFDNWNQIPHDTYRLGIYKDGKLMTPPSGWNKREKKIQSQVGRE
jgi:hypothetical protein